MPSAMDQWMKNMGAVSYPPPAAGPNTAPVGPASPDAPVDHWWDKILPGIGSGIEAAENATTQKLSDAIDSSGNSALKNLKDGIYGGASLGNSGMMASLDATVFVESKLWSRPISTLAQAATVSNPLYDNFNGVDTFKQMWEASETLSPGQAIWWSGEQNKAAANNLDRHLMGMGDAPRSGPNGEAGNIFEANFDIYKNQEK